MATIALTRPVITHRASGIDTVSPTVSLDSLPTAPNKHMPDCPPGPPRPEEATITPPRSPDSGGAPAEAMVEPEPGPPLSLLSPPDAYPRLSSGSLALYKIDAAQVAAALDHAARQPLPDPTHVFPWLHGLHHRNQIQQAFFVARRRSLRRVPTCLRVVTVVKAGGDLTVSRLKGAIGPDEFMSGYHPEEAGAAPTVAQREGEPSFLDVDPQDGFSVRNFHIQAGKMAAVSDVIVYGGGDDDERVRKLGWEISAAQRRQREKQLIVRGGQQHCAGPEYHTFICTSPFAEFEARFPDLVAVDSSGEPTDRVLDFSLQERREMYAMSAPTELSHNVWLGPTPDPVTRDEDGYDVLIECGDLGRLKPSALQAIAECGSEKIGQPYVDFPSSGSILPPAWSHAEADGILDTCKWIYHIAHGTYPDAGDAAPSSPQPSSPRRPRPAGIDRDAIMVDGCDDDDEDEVDIDFDMDDDNDDAAGSSAFAVAAPAANRDHHDQAATAPTPAKAPPKNATPRRILIHCADGYTESSMLAIAYYSYSTWRTIPEAWSDLHNGLKRNFFAYSTDVALLSAIGPRLLAESPLRAGRSLLDITDLVRNEPRWFASLDGSLPSRILDYMYLGNLNHANNPELLRAIGIGQVLSVGETASWRKEELDEWGADKVFVVQGVQDNGVDPLTNEFGRCLEFIDRGRRNGTATLVHCRVGVSRSATICIAEVMRAMDLSFPRAYCFVRARRLNVIIQPHLRFAYELLKWEEHLKQRRSESGADFKREMEWTDVCREIALMNRPYTR